MIPQDDTATTQQRLLQAAKETVLAHGVRRATATDIAARAGVSRMTLYRTYGTVDELVLDALTVEFQSYLKQLPPAAGTATEGTARDQLIKTVVTGVDLLGHAPLVDALRSGEPELFLTYVIDRTGGSQRAVLAEFRDLLEAGQQDGSIRPLPVSTVAFMLMVAVQSFVLSAGVIDRESDPKGIRRELTELLDRYLRP